MRLTAFPLFRLRAALAGSQPAFGQPLDAGEKAIVAERPADTFGGAQAVHRNSLGWISIRQPAPR